MYACMHRCRLHSAANSATAGSRKLEGLRVRSLQLQRGWIAIRPQTSHRQRRREVGWYAGTKMVWSYLYREWYLATHPANPCIDYLDRKTYGKKNFPRAGTSTGRVVNQAGRRIARVNRLGAFGEWNLNRFRANSAVKVYYVRARNLLEIYWIR